MVDGPEEANIGHLAQLANAASSKGESLEPGFLLGLNAN
jgi:hypothetical protein